MSAANEMENEHEHDDHQATATLATAEDESPAYELLWIDPYALWKWTSLKDQNCSICRISLNEMAIVAVSASDDVHDNAHVFTDVYKGSCGHMFHRACIERWLKRRPVCPLCLQPWTLQDVKTSEQ